MKIRDVLKVEGKDLPGAVRSAGADRTRTMLAPVGLQDRIVHPGSHDILPDADPTDGMTGDIPVALDPPPISLAPISTPHTRDLDFIKAQIARLPRPTEQ